MKEQMPDLEIEASQSFLEEDGGLSAVVCLQVRMDAAVDASLRLRKTFYIRWEFLKTSSRS